MHLVIIYLNYKETDAALSKFIIYVGRSVWYEKPGVGSIYGHDNPLLICDTRFRVAGNLQKWKIEI